MDTDSSDPGAPPAPKARRGALPWQEPKPAQDDPKAVDFGDVERDPLETPAGRVGVPEG